jgi:hypothetical protein
MAAPPKAGLQPSADSISLSTPPLQQQAPLQAPQPTHLPQQYQKHQQHQHQQLEQQQLPPQHQHQHQHQQHHQPQHPTSNNTGPTQAVEEQVAQRQQQHKGEETEGVVAHLHVHLLYFVLYCLRLFYGCLKGLVEWLICVLHALLCTQKFRPWLYRKRDAVNKEKADLDDLPLSERGGCRLKRKICRLERQADLLDVIELITSPRIGEKRLMLLQFIVAAVGVVPGSLSLSSKPGGVTLAAGITSVILGSLSFLLAFVKQPKSTNDKN